MDFKEVAMKFLKRISFTVVALGIILTMSGCVYSNNKSWDDLSFQEQQEVKQSLDEVREEINGDLDKVSEELKEVFSDDNVVFALEIVDKVEQAINDSTER